MKEDHRSYKRRFESRTSLPGWIFSGFLFATAKVPLVTAMIFFHIILHPEVLIYDFHVSITSSSSFHGLNTNQFNDLLPVGLLTQLVKHCTGIAEVKGSNLVQAWILFITVMIFFHLILQPQFLYMIFIYS